MQTLLRFLDLVCRELGADDARVEVGGREPTGPSKTMVWGALRDGARVVALWDAPPGTEDELRAKEQRLRALVETFAGVAAAQALPSIKPVPTARFMLDDALDVLAHRAKAERALVIDHASPEVWGSSEVPRDESASVEDAVWLARVYEETLAARLSLHELIALDDTTVRAALVARGFDPAQVARRAREIDRVRSMGARSLDAGRLRVVRALAYARSLEHPPSSAPGHDAAGAPSNESGAGEGPGEGASAPEVHAVVRPFANIYRVVLVFEGPFSELHAEAALIRAMPVIERMVLSLPPRNPEGAAGAGKVRFLRRLRRV